MKLSTLARVAFTSVTVFSAACSEASDRGESTNGDAAGQEPTDSATSELRARGETAVGTGSGPGGPTACDTFEAELACDQNCLAHNFCQGACIGTRCMCFGHPPCVGD